MAGDDGTNDSNHMPDFLSANNRFCYSTQQPNTNGDAKMIPTLIVPSDILDQDQLDRTEMLEEARNAGGGVATKMDEFQKSQQQDVPEPGNEVVFDHG